MLKSVSGDLLPCPEGEAAERVAWCGCDLQQELPLTASIMYIFRCFVLVFLVHFWMDRVNGFWSRYCSPSIFSPSIIRRAVKEAELFTDPASWNRHIWHLSAGDHLCNETCGVLDCARAVWVLEIDLDNSILAAETMKYLLEMYMHVYNFERNNL